MLNADFQCLSPKDKRLTTSVDASAWHLQSPSASAPVRTASALIQQQSIRWETPKRPSREVLTEVAHCVADRPPISTVPQSNTHL